MIIKLVSEQYRNFSGNCFLRKQTVFVSVEANRG